MSRVSDRYGPSGPGAARPASRATARGAVRPRSSSFFSVRDSHRRLCLPAPWPAPAVARPRQPLLFLSFSPRPVRYRLGWLAMARRAYGPGGVGTGTLSGTSVGTAKPLICLILRHGSHCSHSGRAHVMRSRAHAHRNVSLSLGTWEQRCISYTVQWVGAFPRPLPARAALGTWEQEKAPLSSPDRLCGGRPNKIGGGYAGRGREGWIWGGSLGVRGETFGLGGRDRGDLDVDQGEIRGLEQLRDQAGARGGRNGGFPPFLGGRIGQVGTVYVGTVAKSEPIQRLAGARQKLCRLTGSAGAGAIGAALGELGRDRDQAPGTPPNPAPSRPGMLALTFVRIWIDLPASVQPSGLYSDRNGAGPAGEGAFFCSALRGPGGFSRGNLGGAVGSGPARGHSGERAGDDVPSGSTRPPSGEKMRLGAGCGHVNG